MDETARADVIVGVDTHKHVHAAVAIDALGARLGATTIPVGERGYQALEAWARSLGPIRAFGVEGTGSYGAGLSRFLVAQGLAVPGVNRPDRRRGARRGNATRPEAGRAPAPCSAGQPPPRPRPAPAPAGRFGHSKAGAA